MSEHRATIEWSLAVPPADFLKGKYSREHAWTFDGGAIVMASGSPSIIPAPWANPAHVDPEEAFVAALSSCHMLTFVHVAFKAGLVVEHYRDEAVGVMTKNAQGKPWISRVTLSPKIRWGEPRMPSAEELDRLHHEAHAGCFIANSVMTEVVVA
jgi:organic hydroperoxide reductase OsmC/OhrA